jgi:phosphatidylserine/phosphatidylglycerophosphate/cardiolipin synthase-like enzyme
MDRTQNRTRTATVPIATSRAMSAVMTTSWFVEDTEYPPTHATFEPLVNGERTFGALYDDILAATQSIDIVCWGFQPSMYFKRDNAHSLCIGELLLQKAGEGVKVRILCWSDGLRIAALASENMTPGRNLASLLKAGSRNSGQIKYDQQWHRQAVDSSLRISPFMQKKIAHRLKAWLTDDPFANIEFVTRDFSLAERAEIFWHVAVHALDDDRSLTTKMGSAAAMSAEPTHHQKMVLIDYAVPDKAVGFLMGHNTLDAYWDRDDHSYLRRSAQGGRNAPSPRQDISSRLTGPVLEYLCHNFCQGWQRETAVDLWRERKPLASQLRMRPDTGTRVMAQVLRTQFQEGKRDICRMYLQDINNATQLIYIENQYFRWKPLADELQESIQRQQQWGRSHDQHGSVHLFVVTNASDEGMGDGTINTHRMLEALGRAEVMPQVARLERDERLQEALDQATTELFDAQKSLDALNYYRAFPDKVEWEKLCNQRKARVEAAKKKKAELQRQLPEEQRKPIEPETIPGLKVHICTLVSPDSPPDDWLPVYIHSKLMIIDDVFTTLGSSNINTRSMEVDSELNICLEDPAVTRPLRKHLWNLHTNGMGAQDKAAEAFKVWGKIIARNKSRRDRNSKRTDSQSKEAPNASLVEFFRDSPSRTHLD